MSLTVLVMLLPNVCNSISKQLPELFFILYRVLCWRQEINRGEEEKANFSEEPVWPLGNRRESWEAAGFHLLSHPLICRFLGGFISFFWSEGRPTIYISLWIVCSISEVY